jgi:hypothetical protein
VKQNVNQTILPKETAYSDSIGFVAMGYFLLRLVMSIIFFVEIVRVVKTKLFFRLNDTSPAIPVNAVIVKTAVLPYGN